MAKNEKDAICIELPSEILFEIFLRLSVKPLLRFKCVCKSWCSFFQDPSFITMHLNNHVSRNDNGYIIYRYFGGGWFSYWRENFVCREKFIMPSRLLSNRFKIIGSSNGLVSLNKVDRFLFVKNIFSLWIWNPSLRKIMVIPEDYHHCDSVSNGVGFGFGFSPKSNDYKIVKISLLHPRAGIQVPPAVSIYTLSTNSWKQIPAAVPAGWSSWHWDSTVCINGALHWPAPDLGSSWLLWSFKFDEEVFEEIRQPNYESDHGEVIDGMAAKDYKNMLSLICKTGQIYDIWVMEEYGVADSWVKQFTISVTARIWRFHFGDNGEILYIKDGRLVLYDTESIEFKDQGLEGSINFLFSCKESLVSLPLGICL